MRLIQYTSDFLLYPFPAGFSLSSNLPFPSRYPLSFCAFCLPIGCLNAAASRIEFPCVPCFFPLARVLSQATGGTNQIQIATGLIEGFTFSGKSFTFMCSPLILAWNMTDSNYGMFNMRLVVTLLLLAINSFPARASVLLLQSVGADVGDCRQTACLSLSYAISQVQPLDIIRISAGIFTGSLNRNLNPGSLGKSNFTVEGPIVQLIASWGIVAICCYETSSEAFSQQDLQVS